MLWWIYEFIFWVALLVASPYYLLRMKRRGGYAQDFMERFGVFARAKRERLRYLRPVWIHAVSVGEVDLALQVIQKLLKMPTPPPMALSTTTSTGHALAARKLPAEIPLFYYPLDSRFCFGKTHRLLCPQAFLLIEAELWPNHLHFCRGKNIPLLLINARFSNRCYPRYRKLRWFFDFCAFRRVTLQSGSDVESLLRLGFRRDSLTVVGNLKYDTAGSHAERRARLLLDLTPFGHRPFWVAGSTHPGEEEILLDIFRRLRQRHPTLLLGLAPRHAERSARIAALLKRRGISHVLRSKLGASLEASPAEAVGNKGDETETEVLLLDTTGELKYLYERANLVFIGKSLTVHGGQNIIEPAACGKPVLFGPHMENFESIAADFLRANAAIQVQNADELETQLQFLLEHPDACAALGKNASEWVRSKRGGMERTVAAICQVLSENLNNPAV